MFNPKGRARNCQTTPSWQNRRYCPKEGWIEPLRSDPLVSILEGRTLDVGAQSREVDYRHPCPPGFRHLKEPTVKARRRSPYDFDCPFHLHFLHCNVKGPPLVRGGRLEKGRLYPSKRVLFRTHLLAPIFGPFCRKGGPKLEAWRGGSDTLTVEGGRSQECFRFWPPPTSSSWGFVRLPTGNLTTSAPSCSLINRLLELGFCLRRLRRGLLAARLLWQADSWLAHVTPISRKGKYRYQISSSWLA